LCSDTDVDVHGLLFRAKAVLGFKHVLRHEDHVIDRDGSNVIVVVIAGVATIEGVRLTLVPLFLLLVQLEHIFDEFPRPSIHPSQHPFLLPLVHFLSLIHFLMVECFLLLLQLRRKDLVF
jgi:hypothetical protein